MGAGGKFTASDGPGGRAWRTLDAVVAFVAAVFHPIFCVLASVVSASKSKSRSRSKSEPDAPSIPQRDQQQHNKNNIGSSDENDPGQHPNINTSTSASSHDGPTNMPPLLQAQPMAPRPNGSKANGNGQTIKVALPRMGPPNGAAKQENSPANGAAVRPTSSRGLVDATNGSRLRALGEEQAEENRQEQLTLPPPIQPVTVEQLTDDDNDDEAEDPAKAAERAVNHGFMHQALDMVCCCLCLISSRGSGRSQ